MDESEHIDRTGPEYYMRSIAADVRTIRRIVKFFFVLWLLSLLLVPLSIAAISFLGRSSGDKLEDLGDEIDGGSRELDAGQYTSYGDCNENGYVWNFDLETCE